MDSKIETPQATSPGPQKEISRGITAIYKDYLGRGPTHAKTTITDDHAVTTLTDSMTKAEHSLVEGGEAETVREMRRKFQHAMREDITALMGRVTGRECVSFLSDHDTENDIAVEMCNFKPIQLRTVLGPSGPRRCSRVGFRASVPPSGIDALGLLQRPWRNREG